MINYETVKYKHKKITSNEILLKSKEFYKIIKNRRSIRDFKKSSVNDDIIKYAILSAGTAPSGANLQPWHFVIIKNINIKKKIRLAAEKEEKNFYNYKAPQAWLEALEPLGTDSNKLFLEEAPILIAIFEKKFTTHKNKKIKNYYVKESVGIATGILISCLHYSGLCMLTHTPNPMSFLNKILKRPSYEKPFVLLVVGNASKKCKIPKFAMQKKKLEQITSWF